MFQLALTPILLTGGGLMMRSIVAQHEMDAGVDTDRIMWARVDLPDSKYSATEDRVRFYQQLDERLSRLPGVVAALASNAPFGGGVGRNLWRDDEVVSREPRRPRVLVVTTGPRYFDAFRRRIVRGSELPFLEAEGGAASAILNEWLAAAVFPGEDDDAGRSARRIGRTRRPARLRNDVRILRPGGAAAGDGRTLRRHRLCRRATDPRDRDACGAWRADQAHLVAGHAERGVAACHRTVDRNGRGNRRRPVVEKRVSRNQRY